MPIVNAYGKRINFPDDMSHEEIANVISANEKDLNPDYTSPNPEALDYAKGFAAGANKLVSGVGYIAEAAGAKETGKAIRKFGDRGAAYWNSKLSPGGKKAAESQVFVDDPESITGLRLGDDAGKALLMGASQSLPSMFAAALPGVAITKGIQALASLGLAGGAGATIPLLAGTAAPVSTAANVIARVPSAIGFGAAEGIVSGAMNAAEFKSSIEGMSDKELSKSPVYLALKAEHGEEKAKQLIADQAASDIFGRTALSTGAIGAVTGGGALGQAYQKATTGAADGIVKSFLKGAGQEAIQETPQSAGEKYIENLASKDYINPDVDTSSGVLSSAASGGAVGAFTGGIFGAGSAVNITASAQQKADRINAERAKLGLDKIVKSTTVDEAINAANESVSQKPVDKDDVLRVADPTLADIERLTGLKPSESIKEAERQQSILSQAQQENNATQSDIEGQNNRKPKTPRDTEIVLPDNKTLNAQWDIVDADNVKASLKNGESQPRDRTRAASDLQIQDIAKNPDYRRLSDSPVMDIGAPVLSNDGQIVGGNGRFEAISRAYDQDTAQEYIDNLRQDVVRKGIDPAVIDQMKKPVLVRRIMQPFDTRQLAIKSNSGLGLPYSDLELSMLDAERMNGIENLDILDNGNIALTNKNFIQLKDSLGDYNKDELAAIQQKDGTLSQQGISRIRNAILAKAYGDNPILGKIIESTDSDIKTILGSLTRIAGDVIKAKASAPKESDITPSILEAVNIYNQLRQKNQPVSNYLKQQDAFSENVSPAVENILMFLDKNARSQPKLTEFFRDAYTKLGSIDTKTADIFGEQVKPKPEDLFAKQKISNEPSATLKKDNSWIIRNKNNGEVLFETFDKEKVNKLNTDKYEAIPALEYLQETNSGIKQNDLATELQKHLKKNGYEFDVNPVTEREFNALSESKKAQKELAEKQAKIFGKKVVFVKTKGKFGINGVMVPAIKDTIFIDLNTPKPFHAVMAHELSHWMEQENPAAYKDMLGALKDIIINEEGYRRKYNIGDQTEGLIPREIAGDLMGDNFTKPEFWQKVAEYNPSKFKEIAQNVIKWLKNIVLKAKARGMGSEEWVTDAKKAQDIIAKAVSQYTKEQDAEGNDVKFHRAFHGSPHDHNKFDSSKIGTGEGAQAYGYGHYFADSKDVAEYYKKQLSYNGLQSLQDELFDLGLSNYSATRNFAGELISHKGDMRKAADALKRHAESFKNHNRYGEYDELINTHKEVEGIITGGVTKLNVDRGQGKLYEVELAPKQDEYLLWDKPLSEQSKKVKKIIEKAFGESGLPNMAANNPDGQSIYKSLSLAHGGFGKSDSSQQRAASEYLHSIGIRGIKYLDGTSRSKGEGSYNYVIFDDKDIEIKAKFSKQEQDNKDKEYLQAVRGGDIEKAQKMVDDAARDKGYISGAEYRMMHQAPNREDYNLATIKESGIVPDDYWTHPQYYQSDATERESFNKVNSAIDRQKRTGRKAGITVYRAVPKNIKDTNIRNGDWVTPSREYARMEGEGIPGGYRIISAIPNIDNLWWDANSINELGYDDGKEYAYKNTKNNRKLIDAVTYDDDGNVIPLSKRFNSRSDDIRFSKKEETNNKEELPKNIKGLEKSWDAKGISNFISEKDGIITLSKIVIPKEQRNNGIGTSAMNELIDYADRTGQRIALTPSSDFGGNKSRLLSFYKRFGFVENTGRNKDYSISESMYRDAKSQSKNTSTRIPETITIDGIERPTTNSEGKQIHPTEEGIRNFWKWFGDSKVVDDQGRPLVVYHGTDENFNEFDENKMGKNYADSAAANNFFFSSDKEDALYFGANVKEFYLKSNRLKKITDDIISKESDMWLSNLRDSDPDEYDFQINTKQYQNSDGINKGYELAIQDAVSGGYGSTVYENEYGIKWFTVKNPNQIKSAIGNNGEFSESNNDIRFSKTELDEFGEFKTGVPVTFNYLHNKESATELLGIPKNREDRFGRFYEPSGKYIIATDDDYLAKSNPKQYEFGQITFNNPLVIKNNDLGWKKELSDKYDGLRGKNLSKALIADGYDGVVTVDKYGTSEILDLTSFDESKAKFSQEKPFNPNEDIPETKAQKAQRIGQDKFNRFRVIKEWLAKEKGINLSEAADVYGAEERYYGKVANQQEDFREKVRNQLIEKIAKAGYKLDDVEQYLLNRHAQEANAQNRKLTGKDDSTAFGISDAEAQAYLDKAPKELAKLADEVQALTDKAQQLRLDNGIETQERVDAMKGAYKYYVPVRGDAESQQKQNQYKGTGKGFSMKYKPKRRLGHELRNESVIENIFQDYERAIMQVEKNRVGKSLALMAAEIQMPELISINQPVKRKVLQTQKAYGVLVKGELYDVFQNEEAAKQNRQLLVATDKKLTLSDITIAPITDQHLIYSASPMLADNEVLVYMNGHEIRLQINDELLARAYKNMGTEALGNILSTGRAINGWMSKAYTGYNPEFILTNLIRDFTSGIINLTGEQGLLMAAKAVANYPKSFASLLKYAFNGKSDKWIAAYRDNGGNTGAAYLPDLERLGEEVKREYASYQGVIANLKEGDSANALRAAGRKAFNATLKYINHLNSAGENAFRLATFMAMVESGKSVNEAASMAKNVTVNFNRKGEMGAELNALYLFFNASLQGTAATSHALFKGRHKFQAWGLSGSMMAVGYMMASMLGGFDDEDKYDEIGDATKSRNLIMAYGNGHVKIPIPYGYGFFYNAGRMYAEAQRKGEVGKMPYQLMALATEEFSPFNVATTEDSEFSSKKVFYGFLPTMLKIPAEITNNYSSFANRELYPEKTWYQSEPDNEKMWRGTKGTVYDISAQYLASIGVEVSPETLKYMARTATGGSGAFVDSAVSGAMLKSQGAELESREIPFARKFYGENTIQDARARYGKAKEEARIAFEKFNALKKKNDIESVRKFVNDKKELLALNSYANKLSDVIKSIRDQQDLIKLSDKYTTAEKRLKIKELENQEKKYYDMFMKQYKTVKH